MRLNQDKINAYKYQGTWYLLVRTHDWSVRKVRYFNIHTYYVRRLHIRRDRCRPKNRPPPAACCDAPAAMRLLRPLACIHGMGTGQ
eukprot:scaffold44492_cov56-Attheya_sp.AAC.6